MAPLAPTVKLASGYDMPLVGYGTWKVSQDTCADAVYNAIKVGYRHIDGAQDYANSKQAGEGVRRALADGLVRRDELFITSKLWNNYHAAAHAIAAARRECATWGLSYLDLFQVHFPIAQEYIPPEKLAYPTFWEDAEKTRVAPRAKAPLHETWAALESLVLDAGETPSADEAAPPGHAPRILRSLGVANFNVQLLYDLLTYARTPCAVLQIELHPYLTQARLVAMAQENGVVVTAYSSFGPASFVEIGNAVARAMPALFDHATVVDIAKRHGRTPAQVLLRWSTQRGVVVIPKSNSVKRMEENLDCCGFELEREEMDAISGLDQGLRFNDPARFGLPIFA